MKYYFYVFLLGVSLLVNAAPADCDVIYYKDKVCDDSPQDCGSYYKEGTSIDSCNECQTGGFDCSNTGSSPINTVPIAKNPPSSSVCDKYYGDAVCDDSQEDCGTHYKSGLSAQSCNECQTGGFDCSKIVAKTPTPTISTIPASCQSRSCGNYKAGASCQCDSSCAKFGDCCSDYQSICGSQMSPPSTPSFINDDILSGLGKTVLKKGQWSTVFNKDVGMVIYEIQLVDTTSNGATVKVINKLNNKQETKLIPKGETDIVATLDVHVFSSLNTEATLLTGAEYSPVYASTGKPNLKIESVDTGIKIVTTGADGLTHGFKSYFSENFEPDYKKTTGIWAKKKVWDLVLFIPVIPIPRQIRKNAYYELDQNGNIRKWPSGEKYVGGKNMGFRYLTVGAKIVNNGQQVYDEFKVKLQVLDKNGWNTVSSLDNMVLIDNDGFAVMELDMNELNVGTNKLRVIVDEKDDVPEANENDNQYVFDMNLKKL
jgi:hypothetical protein